MSEGICLDTLEAEGVREVGTATGARCPCVAHDLSYLARKEQNERSKLLVQVMGRGTAEVMMISSEGMKWLMPLSETS